MKRFFRPMNVGAMALALAVFVYAFSFPLAVYFTLWYLPRECIPYVEEFYGPANEIVVRCAPYRAIIDWQARMLGVAIHYNIPPPGFP
jgi:hypothetical protein